MPHFIFLCQLTWKSYKETVSLCIPVNWKFNHARFRMYFVDYIFNRSDFMKANGPEGIARFLFTFIWLMVKCENLSKGNWIRIRCLRCSTFSDACSLITISSELRTGAGGEGRICYPDGELQGCREVVMAKFKCLIITWVNMRLPLPTSSSLFQFIFFTHFNQLSWTSFTWSR